MFFNVLVLASCFRGYIWVLGAQICLAFSGFTIIVNLIVCCFVCSLSYRRVSDTYCFHFGVFSVSDIGLKIQVKAWRMFLCTCLKAKQF